MDNKEKATTPQDEAPTRENMVEPDVFEEGQAEAGTNDTREARDHASASVVSRRTFVLGAASTAALLGLGAMRFAGSTPLVRPPGGQDEVALMSKCIHCNRCVEVCPERVLTPQKLEYGLLGMRTPHMSFSDNKPGDLDALKYCDFCEKANGGVPLCVQVCPSEALVLDEDFDFKTHVLGYAELDKDLCMAYRSGFCAFCHNACIEARGEDLAAIYYEGSIENGSQLPKVDIAKCNGCGACEAVCVSAQAGSTRNREVRAIVVKSPELLEEDQGQVVEQ